MQKPMHLILSLSLLSSMALANSSQQAMDALKLESLKAKIETLSGNPYKTDQDLSDFYKSISIEERISLLKFYQRQTEISLDEIKRIEAEIAQAGHPLEQVPLSTFVVAGGATMYSLYFKPKSKASWMIAGGALLLTAGITVKNGIDSRPLMFEARKLPQLKSNLESSLRSTAALIEASENELLLAD